MSFPGVQDAQAALVAALEVVDGLRVYPEPEDVVDPPAAILGPPDFGWDGTGVYPVTATWTLAVCVPGGTGHAMADLLSLLPAVSEAVHSVADTIVTGANAGTFRASSAELPAYFFTIEAAL